MLARALLLSLALSLVAASPRIQRDDKLRCANVKPLSELSIQQLRGDWITLGRVSPRNGTIPASLPVQDPAVTSYSTFCIFVNVNEHSTEERLTLALKFRLECNERQEYEDEYLVSATEKGRWSEIEEPEQSTVDEYLVIAAVPDKYMVLVACAAIEPSLRLSTGHFVDEVYVVSRFSPTLGRPAISDQEYREILQQTAASLGLDLLNLHVLETGCFSDHK